ncbi:adult-specific rigid cuticular protein 15.7 [Galendromus occidentalis]|uniref:Adult-specific rigid cuticular protein 15.7 n=1 Tax=Galendromus occidentalis TaxID=34638 RepID=A0AAJ6QM08_9ACAR|nr:adult-specific rigid cuticular protein 15.7 [Galendromus occidentalis]
MLGSLLAAASLLSVAIAGHIGGHGGQSSALRHQDDYGNYEFKYDIKDGYGNVNGRHEKGGHHGVVGSYYLGEIDGRHRSVEYQADKLGFRAAVKTNEPGTKSSEPAFAPYSSAFGKTIPSGAIHAAHGGYGHHGY